MDNNAIALLTLIGFIYVVIVVGFIALSWDKLLEENNFKLEDL